MPAPRHPRLRWTPERLDQASKVVRQVGYRKAVEVLSRAWGRPITYNQLTNALATAGLGPDQVQLTPPAAPAAVDVDLSDLDPQLIPPAPPADSAEDLAAVEKFVKENPLPQMEPVPEPSLDEFHREQEEKAAERREKKLLKDAMEEVKRLRAELEITSKIQAPSQVTIYVPSPTDAGDAVACVVGSDWHVEETVEPHTVHGINEYNLDIAESRAGYFFQNSARLATIHARESRIKRLWFGALGDLYSGYIHEELMQTNGLPPEDAANFALLQIVKGIEFWLKETPFAIDVDTMFGNHGRMTKKGQIQNAAGVSLEKTIFRRLADRYENHPRVSVRLPEGKMLYRRYFEKFVMRLVHGDDIKFGGGVGGITIPVRKKIAAWDKAQPASLTVMGHFHQRMDGGDFIVNGSLIGYNEFAQAIGASPEEAQQAFFLIHARKGGQKSVVAPIWLDNAHAIAKPGHGGELVAE